MSSPIVGDQHESPAVVAIGASAGGIEPLLTIVRDLPASLPAAVLVVVHVPATGPSALPKIVARSTDLPVSAASDGQAVEAGHVAIAPPDHHLTIDNDGRLLVRRGPTVNRSRPAIDPLFQSVALHVGPRAIGVILSGALDDGAAGLAAISQAGGTAIVQEPAEAVYPSMPEAALERGRVQHRLPAAHIAHTIVSRLEMPQARVHAAPPNARRLAKELSMNEMGEEFVTTDELGQTVSVFGCPACGGTLWELKDGGGFRFRCRIGHAFSPRNLLEAQGTSAEDGLWIAVRALDEQAGLARRLADEAGRAGHELSHRRFTQQAEMAERHAVAIRELLRTEPGTPQPDEDSAAASEAAASTEATR